MSQESNRDTFGGYLGPSFQVKALWQILVEPEFAKDVIPELHTNYFDNQIHKRLFHLIKKYFTENEKPPNVRNRSINEYINGSNLNEKDKEELFGVVNQIINYDTKVSVGTQFYDGDVVIKKIWSFIKQQEYKKFSEKIQERLKTGDLDENVHEFDEMNSKLSHLGQPTDFGDDVYDDIDETLADDYRQPIPTGVKAFDQALAGGLGGGEIGILLMPYGAGKTTSLTKFANTAYEEGKNVLQIFFEDNKGDVKRKHYAIWSDVPLSQFKERKAEVKEKVIAHKAKFGGKGRIVLQKFDEDGTTIPKIRNWILNYQKTFGIKFDIIILDYLDCVESHKQSHGDSNKDELVIIKSFISLLSELNVPGWTAVQGNRASLKAEFVSGGEMGGSIKRGQKTHILISAARSPEQKAQNLANFQIIKSRISKDGQMFENAIFNNDTLEIRCLETPSVYNKPKSPPKSNNDVILGDSNLDFLRKIADNSELYKHKKQEENNPPDNQEDKENNDNNDENSITT